MLNHRGFDLLIWWNTLGVEGLRRGSVVLSIFVELKIRFKLNVCNSLLDDMFFPVVKSIKCLAL